MSEIRTSATTSLARKDRRWDVMPEEKARTADSAASASSHRVPETVVEGIQEEKAAEMAMSMTEVVTARVATPA